MGCASSRFNNEGRPKLLTDSRVQDERCDTASVILGDGATGSQQIDRQCETNDAMADPSSEGSSGSGMQQTSASAGVEAAAVMAVMQQVKRALQQLDGIRSDGSRAAAQQAADVLLQQLDMCDMISVHACTGCGALMAGAAGHGSDIVGSQLVSADSQHSAVMCSSQTAGLYLYASADVQASRTSLPQDWVALQDSSSLRSFLAVRVQAADGVALGVLTLASKKALAFHDVWLEPLISMVCSGLRPFLSHPLMVGLCRLADRFQAYRGQEYGPFVAELLQATADVLKAGTKRRVSLRLGLTTLKENQQAIAILHDVTEITGELVPDAPREVGVVTVPASPTLLLEALRSNAPQSITDTQQYLETTVSPALDLFLDGQPAVASVIVVPFSSSIGGSADTGCRAGLYLASMEATDFAGCMTAITSTVAVLQWLLAAHLEEGGMLQQACGDLLGKPTVGTVPVGSQKSPQQQSLANAGSTGGSIGSSKKSDMSGLMQMLQQQMRNSIEQKKLRALRKGTAEYLEDLVLQRVLGTGGFGTVYAGRWKGSPAAIKIMAVPKQQRQMMKSAMEMAVQESLSHPNIVRVYAVHADMVQEEGIDVLQSTFRRYGLEDEDEDQMICNIMIMELCEQGSLHDNICKGFLHHRDQAGIMRVNLAHLLLVLMDIVRSLQHLHARGLIHCDLKPANVLLKRSSDSTKGYICKLADFGLVKMLGEGREQLNNKSVSGTITHVPPERFKTGTPLTGAVDIYAFGMIMYELYTGKRPFSDQRPGQIVASVLKGDRPLLAGSVPDKYKELTEACWAQNSRNRPTADQVMERLSDILDSCAREHAKRGPSRE